MKMNTNIPQTWDIWLAKVFFEDKPKEAKLRPVLVISPNTFIVISIKITSHEPRKGYYGEYAIKQWQEAGLSKPSTVRISQILNIPISDFTRKMGRLHPIDIREVKNLLSRK